MIKYVLKSILNQAGSVWQVESMPMARKEAERLLRRRLSANEGNRRYGLFKV
tara:strand:- start:57 stop:212 length:156 start_codon:yes stop_codon:yes gene_type:complete